jgi:hypothetical protein
MERSPQNDGLVGNTFLQELRAGAFEQRRAVEVGNDALDDPGALDPTLLRGKIKIPLQRRQERFPGAVARDASGKIVGPGNPEFFLKKTLEVLVQLSAARLRLKRISIS